LGPGDLTEVLASLSTAVDPRLLVGAEGLDDAAALRVSDDLAILFTADFITPVVDDARSWGRIAAANALSDIYAMGGHPLAALNLVCWPSQLSTNLLTDVLAGGADAATDAQCIVAGGHTVQDDEPKYGLAVIGTVRPEAIVRNRGAQAGDLLYLTKPLGTGVIATAIKADLATEGQMEAAVQSMGTLSRAACDAALAAGAHAMTDVTGFGLAGHLLEMLGTDTSLGARISLAALPVLPGVREHMAMGLVPRGAYRNRDAYLDRMSIDDGQTADLLLYDPQTSGGLLIAIPRGAAPEFESAAAGSSQHVFSIGEVTDSGRLELQS
jgi:selenide,water dikinase